MNKEYIVQPHCIQPRNGDDKAGERMRKLFVPATKKEYEGTPTMGNLKLFSYFNGKTKRVVITKKWPDYLTLKKSGHAALYQCISAALALYRAICLFPRPNVICEGSEGYKYPWALPLKHVETGEILVLCEWKGGFGFHTRFHSPQEAPKAFLRDTCRLLTLMMSSKCPHPYDKVVAGSVA